MLFTELPLCDTLLEGLQAMNFRETTPVQEQAIPVILEKKDVIACAQTGTGKTAAFLLPLLNNLQTDAHNENKVNAIIIAPTRELAQQIDQQMEGFSYFTPFSSVAVYGGNDGEAWEVQKRGLLGGADVVIATPGRLLSHINLYNIDFSGVKYFILDEADRMLDMGFHDDIMKIEKLLPKERQTVMFSATMPAKIQQLAKSILRDPVDVAIAISRPPETILQSAYMCHEAQKINIVKHLFKEKAPNKVILFSGSKQKVKEIAKILKRMGLSAGEMHSDLDQSQRNHIMHEFKNERVAILVATDIVARGIDIDDITLVINFDVPYDAEDYVHRIGRTARAGDSGMAITFVSPDEQYRFSKIEQFLGKQIYRIPVPPELGETPLYNPVRDNRRRGISTRSSKGGGRKGTEAGRKGGKSPGRAEKSEIPGKSESPEKSEIRESPERPHRGQENSKILQAPEKPERQERTGRQEKPERQEKPGKQERHERAERPGKTGRPEHSDNQDGALRTEKAEKPKTPRRDQGARSEREPQENVASRPRSGSQELRTSRHPRGSQENETPRPERSSRKNEGSRPERGAQQNEASRSGKSPREGQASRKQGAQNQQTAKKGAAPLQQGASGEERPYRGRRRSSQAPRKQRAPQDSNSPNPKRASSSQKTDPASKQAGKTAEPKKKWSWWPFGKK